MTEKMISQESAKAYREAALHSYVPEKDIKGAEWFSSAMGFGGQLLDIADSIEQIKKAVKDEEQIDAFDVPRYFDYPHHMLIICPEGCIRLAYKSEEEATI